MSDSKWPRMGIKMVIIMKITKIIIIMMMIIIIINNDNNDHNNNSYDNDYLVLHSFLLFFHKCHYKSSL